MIEVELPDGTIAEFPDGTPHDVITRVMRDRFGGPRSPHEQGQGSSGEQTTTAPTSAAGRAVQVFTVETPSGRKIRIEAPDAATAIRGAQEWESSHGSQAEQPQLMRPETDVASVPGGVPEAQQPGMIGDLLSSLGTGLREGVEGMASLPGDLNRMAGQGVEGLAGWLGASPETAETIGNVTSRMSVFGGMPTSDVTRAQTQELIGDALTHDPQTTAGEYARTTGQFMPGMLMGGPQNMLARGVTNVLAPALGSETAGQLTKGTAAEPYARFGGAIAGAAAPSMLRRAVSPLPVGAERSKHAALLKREGVDLTAGQKTGRETLRYAESELGGGRAAAAMNRQSEQFTAAALKRAGIRGETRASMEVIDNAFAMQGERFNRLAAQTTAKPDPQFWKELRQTFNWYGQNTNQTARVPIVENLTRDIVNVARRGPISGPAYQKLHTEIRKAIDAARRANDFQRMEALNGMKNALDGAVERSFGNDSLRNAWRNARREYANLNVVTDAVSRGGEQGASGIITPSALKMAVQSSVGRRNMVRGKADLAPLARAGEAIMKPLPQSGTAPRTTIRNMFTGPAALAGGVLGGAGGNIPGAVAGMAAGAAAPYAAGRALMSRPVQGYLSNQAAAGGVPMSLPRVGGLGALALQRPGGIASEDDLRGSR